MTDTTTKLTFGDPASIKIRDIGRANAEALELMGSTFEERLKKLREIVARNPNPWRINIMKNWGDDWCIASFGADSKRREWILTTDHVRCSEYEGDAEDDAMFCALAKSLMPELLKRLDAQPK